MVKKQVGPVSVQMMDGLFALKRKQSGESISMVRKEGGKRVRKNSQQVYGCECPIWMISGSSHRISKTDWLKNESKWVNMEEDGWVWDYPPTVFETFEEWWIRVEPHWKRVFCKDFWGKTIHNRTIWVIRIRNPGMFWFRGMVSTLNFNTGIRMKWKELIHQMNSKNPEPEKRIICFITDSLEEPFLELWTNEWTQNVTKWSCLVDKGGNHNKDDNNELIHKDVYSNHDENMITVEEDRLRIFAYPLWARMAIWCTQTIIPLRISLNAGDNYLLSSNFRRKCNSYLEMYPEEQITIQLSGDLKRLTENRAS